ncbi:uncharacterized protein BT62DRAFT_932033 [Guyanagaster necrorhizus]|uniref:Uncharacterized protein n=1 Tax=Guyanagaster necrorhizus TaxID=856835 RepID=A0A9P7VSF4_9AGAR|nr:uncharacterized protein BT62DRAFT_932033 [Guyanagaster necrorhizus MCA 3950]KAG7446596.1 hypothetical protein BT62DRAFT_932033 [Guyanagaster necrorhizus MCA 3950]
MHASLLMDVLTLCVQTGHTQHCSMVLEQMMSWANRSDSKELPSWQYCRDLAAQLDEFFRSQPVSSIAIDDPWAPFFRATAEIIIKNSRLDDVNLGIITASLTCAGGVQALMPIMDAEGIAYMAAKKKASVKRLVLHMHAELLSPEAIAQAKQDLDELFMTCVSTVIERFDFAGLSDLTGDGAVNKVIALLKFSFDAGVGIHSYHIVLNQLFSCAGITRGQLLETYLTDILVPFVDLLRTLFAVLGVSIKEGPIKFFCSVVTRLFVSKSCWKKACRDKIYRCYDFWLWLLRVWMYQVFLAKWSYGPM